MTIEFECPHCGKALSTSDDKAARQAKCPGCGGTISVPGDPVEEDDFLFPGESESKPPVPPRSRTCPMCGAVNPPRAAVCSRCGERFPGAPVLYGGPATSGKATAALTFGILSLVFSFCCGCFSLPLSVLAIVFGVMALADVKQQGMEGGRSARAGIICGVISLVIMLGMLVFNLTLIAVNGDFNFDFDL